MRACVRACVCVSCRVIFDVKIVMKVILSERVSLLTVGQIKA